MPLFEHPSGRDLAAFAIEVRQSLQVVSDDLASEARRTLGLTACFLDELADRQFAQEARKRIEAEARQDEWLAAAATAVARKPEPQDDDEHGFAFAHPSLPGWAFLAPPGRAFIFDYSTKTVTVR